MAILVVCPSCQGKMHAPDNAGGRTVQCPKCGEITTVPGTAADDFASPAPPSVPQPPTPMQPRIQAPPPESWRLPPAEEPRRNYAPNWDEDDDYERRQDRYDDDDKYRSERFRKSGAYHPDVFRKLNRYGMICFFIALAFGVVAGGALAAAAALQDSARKYDPRVGYTRPDPEKRRQADTVAMLAIPVVCLAVAFYLAMYVLFMILLYKEWNLIQDGYVRTTPGLAVGLLFVPIFNLYWLFVAYYGLATEMNLYAERHRLQIPRVPDGLVLTWCISIFGGIIPCVGPIIALVSLILYFFMVNALKNGAAAIATAQRDYSPEMEQDM